MRRFRSSQGTLNVRVTRVDTCVMMRVLSVLNVLNVCYAVAQRVLCGSYAVALYTQHNATQRMVR